MTGGIKLTNMAQFQRTLREYREVSKRDDKTIVATKMFYIARGAVRNTYRTPKAKVNAELKALFHEQRQKFAVTRYGRFGQSYQVPLAALIVNASRGRRGLPGLQGAAMDEAVRKFISNRLRSIAFIASGWLPAVKKFEPLAEKKGQAPPRDGSVKQIGGPKGSGQMSGTDFVPVAIIENFAQTNERGSGQALEKHAGEGLQKAFAHEMASMKAYIERKKQETANRFNAR